MAKREWPARRRPSLVNQFAGRTEEAIRQEELEERQIVASEQEINFYDAQLDLIADQKKYTKPIKWATIIMAVASAVQAAFIVVTFLSKESNHSSDSNSQKTTQHDEKRPSIGPPGSAPRPLILIDSPSDHMDSGR
jgi:hypothetical protein